MKHFEFYDNKKTYYSPIGEVFSPDEVSLRYPLVDTELPVVIETDESHSVFFGYGLLSQYKSLLDIKGELSNEEALAEIERISNLPAPAPMPTAEERIAAAMEFQTILLMPNETEV